MQNAQRKEGRPNSTSKGSISDGSSTEAAAPVAQRNPSSKGKGKGKGSARTIPSAITKVAAAVAHAEAGDGMEAAATSSDSDGDDGEECGGSTSAPGRAEIGAGRDKTAQANGHHGSLKRTVSAGGKTRNGRPKAPASKAEVDEHAARASDAAKAAVAALASAPLLAPSCHPSKSKSVAPLCMKPGEEHAITRPSSAEGRRGGRGRHPRPLLLPHSLWVDMPGVTTPSDVERALAAARFMPGRRGNADVARALPPPLVLPTGLMPCMVGSFSVEKSEGVHRCSGTWAMTKVDLETAADVEARASPFEFRTRAGPESFPYSGAYQGHFLVRQPPKPVTRVDEDALNLSFEKNSEGTWNVEGGGRNIYGSFTVIGRLDSKRRLEVYRSYAKAPVRSHRRASVSSHASAATSSAQEGNAPSNQGGRARKRRKHPRSVPLSSRAQPMLPSRDDNGDDIGSDDGNECPAGKKARVLNQPQPAASSAMLEAMQRRIKTLEETVCRLQKQQAEFAAAVAAVSGKQSKGGRVPKNSKTAAAAAATNVDNLITFDEKMGLSVAI